MRVPGLARELVRARGAEELRRRVGARLDEPGIRWSAVHPGRGVHDVRVHVVPDDRLPRADGHVQRGYRGTPVDADGRRIDRELCGAGCARARSGARRGDGRGPATATPRARPFASMVAVAVLELRQTGAGAVATAFPRASLWTAVYCCVVHRGIVAVAGVTTTEATTCCTATANPG